MQITRVDGTFSRSVDVNGSDIIIQRRDGACSGLTQDVDCVMSYDVTYRVKVFLLGVLL